MAFIDLENTAAPKVTVPDDGLVIGSRLAGRGEKKTRYIAMSIGSSAARSIGLTMKEHAVRVQAGAGMDDGKLAIMCDGKGRFVAKRQKCGAYLLTVGARAIGGRFSMEFEKFSVERARFVPAGGGNPGMLIVMCSAEMQGTK